MSKPFSHWLALREPLDIAARSETLTRALTEQLPHDRPIRILDLGTGTGSNVRYLLTRLPPQQHWLMVDYDPGLLARLLPLLTEWAAAEGQETRAGAANLWIGDHRRDCSLEPQCLDLNHLDPGLFAGQDLVTGSALLDLTSGRWLDDLARACAANRAAALFALTYSGEVTCSPAEPEDDRVIALVNDHQRTDKGFGRAAGPDATARAEQAFAAVGYTVRRARTDWTLGAESTELQELLLEGWCDAAAALVPDQSAPLRDWLTRRLEHLRSGRSRIVVSHEDLAAWPSAAE